MTTIDTHANALHWLVGKRAILVHVNLHRSATSQAEDLTELQALALSAGVKIGELICAKRISPDPKYFVGSGKAEEIKQYCLSETPPQVVIFDHTLSSAQKRNLETLLKCRVLDRTELILEIFAQRARTYEGKLQVELASLEYLSTRLVRGWTHLERQKGGIGLRGGPGETQLEVDRRLLRGRVKAIKTRLEKVRKQRGLSRRARQRSSVPTVALIGYTNAGKSTLFNRLTQSHVYVADQLFATLDPTLRRITLPSLGDVVLADTVGFIRDLPHHLVDAFRATLEEVKEADLLLHVVDAHHPDRQIYIEQVNQVLAQLGAQEAPQLLVYNKIDLLGEPVARINHSYDQKPTQVWLSAATGMGIELLLQALTEVLN